jgi:hypothetical protein
MILSPYRLSFGVHGRHPARGSLLLVKTAAGRTVRPPLPHVTPTEYFQRLKTIREANQVLLIAEKIQRGVIFLREAN